MLLISFTPMPLALAAAAKPPGSGPFKSDPPDRDTLQGDSSESDRPSWHGRLKEKTEAIRLPSVLPPSEDLERPLLQAAVRMARYHWPSSQLIQVSRAQPNVQGLEVRSGQNVLAAYDSALGVELTAGAALMVLDDVQRKHYLANVPETMSVAELTDRIREHYSHLAMKRICLMPGVAFARDSIETILRGLQEMGIHDWGDKLTLVKPFKEQYLPCVVMYEGEFYDKARSLSRFPIA